MIEKIQEFLKSDKIKFLLFFTVVFSVFQLGRVSNPTKVLETQKVVIQEHEIIKVVEVEKIVEGKSKDLIENKRIHKEKIVEIKLDGTKIIKDITDINVDKTIKEVEVRFVDRINTIEKEKIVEKKIEIVKLLESKKSDWTVMAHLGTTFTELQPSTTIPYFNPILIGVEINRRIIGPIKTGLWVTSNTNFNNLSGGISVGVEF